jgi:hypothetical protein
MTTQPTNIPIVLNPDGSVNAQTMASNYVNSIDVQTPQVTAVTNYLNNIGKDVIKTKLTTLFYLESLNLIK